jgi:hypothetical protein
MSEYVRCKNNVFVNFTEGKVYKVIKKQFSYLVVIDDNGIDDLLPAGNCEPATDQEWILQKIRETRMQPNILGGGAEGGFILPKKYHDLVKRLANPDLLHTTVVKLDNNPPQFDRVIFSNPATVVFWKDGTKTVAKCQSGDTFSEEIGLAVCYFKKSFPTQRDKDYIKRVIKRAVVK